MKLIWLGFIYGWLILSATLQPAPLNNLAAWQTDLDFLVEQITTHHPEPYFQVSQADFAWAVQRLEENLPTLSEPAIILEMSRLMALLDGHSYLFTLQPAANFPLYPLRLYLFDDGLYITDAQDSTLIGQRVVAINGMSAEIAYAILRPYNSADNEYSLRNWVPSHLISPNSLVHLGIINDPHQPNFLVVNAAGQERLVNFLPISLDDYLAWQEADPTFSGLPPHPELLYTQQKGENFWFTYLADSETLYIQHNVTTTQTQSGASMSSFSQAIEETISTESPQRVVIDLRHNLGGNKNTYQPLLTMLTRTYENSNTQVFILVGRQTFSAAIHLAIDLKAAIPTALILGEPTGGSPSTYAENQFFRLPNSGLSVSLSRQYVPKGLPHDTRPALIPDYSVPVLASDFFAGRDQALETVIQWGG